MRTVSIRFEDDVFLKIERLRGTKSKSDFCREIIEDSINKNEDASLQDKDKDLQAMYGTLHAEYLTLKAESEHLKEAIRLRDDLINNLQNQNGFLISEFQRINKINEQLLLLPAQEEVKKKGWWQFWKK